MSKSAKVAQNVTQVDTLIIGAGVSGIGAAIRLREEGFEDFLILEKHQDLGGTWRDNTYPGCACDVPSALYSYSFAQKPDWSRTFAGQAEILDYVKSVAEQHGVVPYIHFGVTVAHSQWLESRSCWEVETSAGLYRANRVISCVGYLHEPILPDLPGLADFPGEVFHSSRWNHDIDLRGKRVAVIGTGASAIQFVPEIQPLVSELVLFQRTPQWILPKPDRALSGAEKSLLKLPAAMNAWRAMLYGGFESFGIGFRHTAVLKSIEQLARWHLQHHIKDAELRRRMTPDYTLGCKRILMSNNYYPAVAQPNVEVLATGMQEVRGNVLVGQDGSEREVDVIILGTGFHVSDVPIAGKVAGADGRTLADVWQGSPEAYRGTTISGFPNFFLILGPNLAIGHNSAFIVIEAQLDYVMGALRAMRERNLARLEVQPDAQARYNQRVQKDLQKTVWNTGGCQSYYLDVNGRNSIGFPWSTFTMRRLLGQFDLGAYRTESGPVVTPLVEARA